MARMYSRPYQAVASGQQTGRTSTSLLQRESAAKASWFALEPAQPEALDGWIKKHNVESRPEAIRRLVELGINATKEMIDLLAKDLDLE